MDWDEIVSFMCALPGVSMKVVAKGALAPVVRGKQIVAPGRTPGSIALRATREEIEYLIESDPGTFWQTPQYSGWPIVLVHADRVDPERLKALIERAWWDRASLKQRAAHGRERP
ncbi:MAG: hypothetical protein JSR79_04075 [Proteobacteria bacterium]|nr:hypothetical protein [Pseudomonadota bacterium]